MSVTCLPQERSTVQSRMAVQIEEALQGMEFTHHTVLHLLSIRVQLAEVLRNKMQFMQIPICRLLLFKRTALQLL